MAQSGCLPFGSLLITVRRQSATCHRRGGLLSCGSQHNAISSPRLFRPSPSHHATMGGGSQFVFKYQGQWHFHGSNLLRIFPACGTSGTIPSSHTKGGWRMQRSSIIYHQGTVGLCSLAVPSRHSLTLRSMGRLHHCSLRHSHAGAPYLQR